MTERRGTSRGLAGRRSRSQTRLASLFRTQFGNYRMAEDGRLEPDFFPEKTQAHLRTVEFDKSPFPTKAVSYVPVGGSVNEKRFENVNTLPSVSSKSRYHFAIANDMLRHVSTVLLERQSPRREVFKPGEETPVLFPNKEPTMGRLTYCTPRCHNRSSHEILRIDRKVHAELYLPQD